MKRKPFKAWLLWDAEGTYRDFLCPTRSDAKAEARDMPYRDAKWRITRVIVHPTDTRTTVK